MKINLFEDIGCFLQFERRRIMLCCVDVGIVLTAFGHFNKVLFALNWKGR